MTTPKKDGFTIIQVGRKRSGKTTETIEIVENELERNPSRHLEIYDINAEYSELYTKPFLDFDKFLDTVFPLKRSLIVFEEATIFFTPRGGVDKKMLEKFIRTRHQENIIMLNFHSWGQVPKDVLSMADFVIVRKTNDSEKTLKDKTDNEKLIKAFRKVKESDNNYYKLTINLYG